MLSFFLMNSGHVSGRIDLWRKYAIKDWSFAMIMKFKKKLSIFLGQITHLCVSFFIFLAYSVFNPSQAHAQWVRDGCFVIDNEGDSIPTIKGLECIFENVLRASLSLFGLAVFVVIIIGSMQLLLSGGDPQKAEKAKSTIGWGAGGLAAALGVWFLLLFISNFTGVGGLLDFSITIFGQ